jgi:dTDP-4-amino-4,6-dideoxygalactose transaminase
MGEVKRIPLAVPDLGRRELELVSACIVDNWVSSAGPSVVALENEMARLTGRAFAVATVNGTAALHMALLGIGIGAGDMVIVPDWTFAATANAVAHAGAQPLLVDVSAADWALDAGLVEEALAKHAGVKAVIAVDPLGHAADYDALAAVCDRHGVALIEDAAAAIGASYKGRPCGAFGRAAAFSFNGNKTVTAGGGGALVTDDADLAKLVRHVSTTARVGGDYLHDRVGYNYRMPNLNAALALAQIERLPELVAAKRAIAARYDAALAGRADILPMPRPAASQSTAWLYNARVANGDAARALVQAMDAAAIDARVFWRSLASQPAWRDAPSVLRGVSAALSGTVVSLPCSSSLDAGSQARVIAVLNGWRGEPLGAAA